MLLENGNKEIRDKERERESNITKLKKKVDENNTPQT